MAESWGFAATTIRPAKSGEGDVLNFSLLDYRGKKYELRRADARLVVLFFTGADRPIARQNSSKLQAINEESGPKGVAVWMINAMPQNDPGNARLDIMFELGRVAPRKLMGDRYVVQVMRGLVSDAVLGNKETLRQETRDHVWGSPPLPPVLVDEHQLVSRYFGVKLTCDTVVIDTEKMAVVYRGAVDDQPRYDHLPSPSGELAEEAGETLGQSGPEDPSHLPVERKKGRQDPANFKLLIYGP